MRPELEPTVRQQQLLSFIRAQRTQSSRGDDLEFTHLCELSSKISYMFKN